MRKINLFSFAVKYLGFLKAVPLAPQVFDSLLKLGALIFKNELLDWIDEIEKEVLRWEGTYVSMHKYGGLQFNCRRQEIGHLHSNGLLDVLYSREIKQQFMEQGKITPHHVFKDSGWVSFYICNSNDVLYAKTLLEVAYKKICK